MDKESGLAFPQLDGLAGTALGRGREEEFTRCGQPYMLAMLNGQMLEILTKMAAPALSAPIDDDEVSSRVVGQGLKNRFAKAVNDLAERTDLSVDLSPSLIADLNAARLRRNELAHDWLWIIGPRILTGGADELIAELEADSEEFGRLSGLLMEEVFAGALKRRGVTIQQLALVADWVGARLAMSPERLAGVSFKLPAAADFFARLFTDSDP